MTPAVFGARTGIAPLFICPDTEILIALNEEIDEVGDVFSPISDDFDDDERGSGLPDLIRLWFWRDVRFWTGEPHLTGSSITPKS